MVFHFPISDGNVGCIDDLSLTHSLTLTHTHTHTLTHTYTHMYTHAHTRTHTHSYTHTHTHSYTHTHTHTHTQWKWTVLHSICFRRGYEKQFTKEEYFKRVERIVELLIKHGADLFKGDRVSAIIIVAT